ncbi:MAG: hypothetical protein ACRDVD_03545 [Acidimicrobiia bacterium]
MGSRIRQWLVSALPVGVCLLMSGCLSPAGGGLALVAEVGGDDDVVAGSLMVSDTCVMLSERGHRILTLGWAAETVSGNSAEGEIVFAAADGELRLRDGDRLTAVGVLVPDPDRVAWVRAPGRACTGDGTLLVADVTEVVSNPEAPGEEIIGGEGPIGGGRASGTGSDVALECPLGVEKADEEWFGPAGLTLSGAVAEAFGDLTVGWIGEPFEVESTDEWSSWGLRDAAGHLVAVATVVVSGSGWDPSHARYCVIPEPTPPPPPFTLYISNQSFVDPTVTITITIDGERVIDQDFDVEGQHNWIEFIPDAEPGDHILTATSNTGAELTIEFNLPDDEPRWAVIDYWYYPDEGPRKFTFDISDEPLAFD